MSHHHHHRHYGLLLGAAGIAAASGGSKSPPVPSRETRDIQACGKILRAYKPEEDGKTVTTTIAPLDFRDRSGNELRPQTFDEMVGQLRIKALFRRMVAGARASHRTLDHILLVGGAGTGKTTLAQVIAYELGRRCFMLKAPVPQDLLEALARSGRPGDIVILDEAHMAAKGDRRGANPVAAPEALLLILEDHRLQCADKAIPFPDMTWIACTTDVGMLPEPLISRFPLQPHLDDYTVPEMAYLAIQNARSLGMSIGDEPALILARASGLVPRQTNRYIRNARSLGATSVTSDLAVEIVVELNGYTLDGLSPDQQNVLRFLLRSGRRVTRGEVVYQASVNALATATGHARDTKAIQLLVEPGLIRAGLMSVQAQGRRLTEAGVERAEQL